MGSPIEIFNPSTVPQVPEAFCRVYSHATAVPAGTRLLFISGQVGVRPDGTLADGFVDQMGQAMSNVENLLAAADMTLDNLAKLTFYMVRVSDGADLVRLRNQRWASAEPPAVTVVTVTALARPEFLVEIEAVAAG